MSSSTGRVDSLNGPSGTLGSRCGRLRYVRRGVAHELLILTGLTLGDLVSTRVARGVPPSCPTPSPSIWRCQHQLAVPPSILLRSSASLGPTDPLDAVRPFHWCARSSRFRDVPGRSGGLYAGYHHARRLSAALTSSRYMWDTTTERRRNAPKRGGGGDRRS